jgi:hypothetical protein
MTVRAAIAVLEIIREHAQSRSLHVGGIDAPSTWTLVLKPAIEAGKLALKLGAIHYDMG